MTDDIEFVAIADNALWSTPLRISIVEAALAVSLNDIAGFQFAGLETEVTAIHFDLSEAVAAIDRAGSD
ncbi:MAG: hypothetical protein WDN28_25370 [Chthoniobacter sp.]